MVDKDYRASVHSLASPILSHTTLLGECRAFVGRAQQHVLSMFLRMRNATGRSMTYIQVGRYIQTELALTSLVQGSLRSPQLSTHFYAVKNVFFCCSVQINSAEILKLRRMRVQK